ncbi:hypothetical protein OG730_42415 (plasmid) [Streptomyces sp. NBC_01298]|uniref:hypothetical protein n=1 Tax=Streptomyces sp. NBC_01298 TaxID=2903817 RepID=UPI002E0DAC40|nr:hypothetical protein OG730_42415 [Streptomyces sp. NBC_01298]
MTTAVSRSRTVTARIDTAPASPGGFTVTAFVSVEEFPFHGYQPASRVAEVTTVDNTSLRLLFARSRVADHHDAAATAFEVSIGHACDDLGRRWPADVRPLSIGDVLEVTSPDGTATFFTIDGVRFREIEPPTARVPLAGTLATSRTT